MIQVDLKGKAALVTGGNRGIGRSVALALAKHGAACITGRNREALEAQKHNVKVTAQGKLPPA